MIKQELLDVNYYLSKLSLLMRQSGGYEEQFRFIDKILVQYDDSLNQVMERLNVYDNNYLSVFGDTVKDILDKIAGVYGVTRQFSMYIIDPKTSPTKTVYEANLSDAELLVLIKATIIKNACDGSREQIQNLMNSIGLQNYMFISTSTNPAECNVYILDSGNITDNIRRMILAGLIMIESLGIRYNYNITDTSVIGLYDTVGKNYDTDSCLYM